MLIEVYKYLEKICKFYPVNVKCTLEKNVRRNFYSINEQTNAHTFLFLTV